MAPRRDPVPGRVLHVVSELRGDPVGYLCFEDALERVAEEPDAPDPKEGYGVNQRSCRLEELISEVCSRRDFGGSEGSGLEDEVHVFPPGPVLLWGVVISPFRRGKGGSRSSRWLLIEALGFPDDTQPSARLLSHHAPLCFKQGFAALEVLPGGSLRCHEACGRGATRHPFRGLGQPAGSRLACGPGEDEMGAPWF